MRKAGTQRLHHPGAWRPPPDVIKLGLDLGFLGTEEGVAGENSAPWGPMVQEGAYTEGISHPEGTSIQEMDSDGGHSEMALKLQPRPPHSGIVNGEAPLFTDSISHIPTKGHRPGVTALGQHKPTDVFIYTETWK